MNDRYAEVVEVRPKTVRRFDGHRHFRIAETLFAAETDLLKEDDTTAWMKMHWSSER